MSKHGAAEPVGERAREARTFPIQHGEPIPWAAAEKAYEFYAKLFGRQQSLERLAQRGGFGLKEWACLYLAHDADEYHYRNDADKCVMQALRLALRAADTRGEPGEQVKEALAEVPDAIWALADAAERLRQATATENGSGMMGGSGLAIRATDRARTDFMDRLRVARHVDVATALCVLRGIRACAVGSPSGKGETAHG